MKRLHESGYLTLDEDQARRVLVLTRLNKEDRQLDELDRAFRDVFALYQEQHAGYGLVLDMRFVVGVNDDAWEARTAELRRQLRTRFVRTVVVVRTAVGALQVERLARNEGWGALVATDLDEAVLLADPQHGPAPERPSS